MKLTLKQTLADPSRTDEENVPHQHPTLPSRAWHRWSCYGPISGHREFSSQRDPKTHTNEQTALTPRLPHGAKGKLVAHGFTRLSSTTKLNEKGFDADVNRSRAGSPVDKDEQVAPQPNRLSRSTPRDDGGWSEHIEQAASVGSALTWEADSCSKLNMLLCGYRGSHKLNPIHT